MSTDPQVFISLFIVASTAMLLMPFYPAWQEWRHPTDQEALRVGPKDADDVATLAGAFRTKMVMLMASGDQATYQFIEEVSQRGAVANEAHQELPVVASRAMQTHRAFKCAQPLFAANDLELAGGAMLSEVLAEGHIALGPHSRITGWAHANKTLTLGESSVAVRQISAARAMDLARGCCFERVHAPVIQFGRPVASLARQVGVTSSSPRTPLDTIKNGQPWGDNGWRVEGDCQIPQAHHFTGSLVVTGVLSIGSDAVVDGDIKARKGILIGARARITGAVFCENGIHVFHGAYVAGPLVSESHLMLGAGAWLGTPDAPTTVSAGVILVEEGVVAHGTVWASQAGVVWGTT